MALFKFRKGRDEQPAAATPAQTVEAVRRRAMHRLVGAAVLVLAGVIGFPLIFDNQPRPIAVDLPIEIVDKNKVKPLVLPPAAPEIASATPPAPPAKTASVEPKVEPAPVAVVTAPAPAPPVAVAKDPAPAAPVAAAPASDARAIDAKKARALLEARPLASANPAAVANKNTVVDAKTPVQEKAGGSEDRFVVQVGAFADPAKVREVRRKVEAAGLKTYTQVVGTSEGDRTRVRVGPFSDKVEADKAADKIRKLSLPAAVLTL